MTCVSTIMEFIQLETAILNKGMWWPQCKTVSDLSFKWFLNLIPLQIYLNIFLLMEGNLHFCYRLGKLSASFQVTISIVMVLLLNVTVPWMSHCKEWGFYFVFPQVEMCLKGQNTNKHVDASNNVQSLYITKLFYHHQ